MYKIKVGSDLVLYSTLHICVSEQKIVGFQTTTVYIAHAKDKLFIAHFILILPPLMASAHEHFTMKDIKPKMTSELSFEIKFHGFLLWASVGFLMPVGILVKRMSLSIKDESSSRFRMIFYIHVIMEVLAVILGTAGAVMSIRYFDNSFKNDHQRIGLAFYVMMWVQALVAFFRPTRGSKGRSIWFVVHWVMGSSVCLLGVMNIYTGLEAYHNRTSKNVSIWTILFTIQICCIVFVYLVQEKWHYIHNQASNKPLVQPADSEISSSA